MLAASLLKQKDTSALFYDIRVVVTLLSSGVAAMQWLIVPVNAFLFPIKYSLWKHGFLQLKHWFKAYSLKHS